ncbi:MAG TPA: FadR/GntR family transcriptional regulator [Granulicella sp.]|jgi:GntR family transcriptional repressor for pyruvate dehydrogenase complex
MKVMPVKSKSVEVPSDGRVTARLISRIKNMIADGTLTPGTKFPPERDLAIKFSANRTSVRQALKVLEIMGVLTQRVGDGTYLSNSAETILSEPLDFLVLLDDLSHHELFETRLIVEPELTARAAERATTEDIAALRAAVSAMEKSKNTKERLSADMAFHDAVFRASGNRICQLLFKQIHRTVLTSMSHLSNRVELDQPLMYHRRIYKAIRERDAEAARLAMREHILDARALLDAPVRTAE